MTHLGNMLERVLPRGDCMLCGQPGCPRALCPACRADIPRLPAEQCPCCALPTPAGQVCGACLRHPPAFDATLVACRYGFPLDGLIQSFKYGHRLAVAPLLAKLMATVPPPPADLLLPVPLSAAHLRERGFNQAVEIARPLGRRFGLPLELDACIRIGDAPRQAGLPWDQRRRNVRHGFECRADLTGQHVLVLDDVMTTGATLDELARTLKRHGAARVTNWVVARAVRDGQGSGKGK
ncbi:MAG TPA: ComF family protein [Rhodocyclaceae bacterium]|nr:ComF family protein [Rhodocyclaceae bacterium]